VGELGGWEDSEWRWRMCGRRVGYQWKASQEDEMLKMISKVTLYNEAKDTQVWRVDTLGVFL